MGELFAEFDVWGAFWLTIKLSVWSAVWALLLGTGLAGIGAMARRRRRQA